MGTERHYFKNGVAIRKKRAIEMVENYFRVRNSTARGCNCYEKSSLSEI